MTLAAPRRRIQVPSEKMWLSKREIMAHQGDQSSRALWTIPKKQPWGEVTGNHD